jgi:lipopolysaccharide/colanic/teichoic acid biosynthesis glycosyltransferase
LFLVVALAIKLYDGGPVFYKQRRATKDLKEFDILKFRSMVVDAEKDGPQPAVDNDKRITPIGKVIRALRIDELPQIINILKGEMSIVGPRPERIEHVEKYSEEIPEFVCRYKVKGGLTGYAQVFGKYNTSAYNKLKMDLIYIQNYSLALDLKLILMTVKILFKTVPFPMLNPPDNSKNNMIALPEGELVVVDGLDNYLVARDNGVLLICPKDQEAKIRQYVKDVEEKFGDKYI